MNNYVYILDGKAYVNITNKCHNACTLCIRNTGDGVAGVKLWLDEKPTADDVLRAFDGISDKLGSDEVVFCGYGEPTEELALLIDCADKLKARGYKLRLNTNGLGSVAAGVNIAPMMKKFDTVSISLNEADAQSYLAVTRSKLGLSAYGHVLDFAACCKREGVNTVFTVVDTIGENRIKKCREISDKMGIPLRVRAYVADNYNG